MEKNKATTSHRVLPYAGVALFLLALLPRIAGLLTFESSDERWGASARVLTGDLSGGTSQTLPLVNYLNAASFVVLYAIGRLVGVWHGTADFRAQYFIDRSPFVFSGRLVAASLGALSAPLSALIARRLGLTRSLSLIVGVMFAILPASVLFSHHAKPDSGVALGVLLVAWAILRKLDDPTAKGADMLVGIAIAISVSFKQTAVFLVAPALVGFAGLLRWDCGLPWSRIARSALVSLLACVLAWVPMNIGILLDPLDFLDYQRATALMMSREATAYQIARHVVALLADNVTGLTTAGLLAFLLAPFIRREPKFLTLWVSTAFAYVVFPAISGGVRIAPRYLLPYNALAFTLGCTAVLSMIERGALARAFGALLAIAILLSECLGFIDVVGQALLTPMSVRCSELIKSIVDPDQDKIFAASAQQIKLPIDAAASDEERNRHERLARKYGVTLEERAEESKSHRYQAGRGYFLRIMPFAMGGMEDLEAGKAARAVKPYWWPIQPEEWKLDYWTRQGFDVFIVLDESAMLSCGIPEYESLHRQIKDACELVAVVTGRRYLFGEGEMKIYRLRGRGPVPATGTTFR
jgi:hypothetical protein